MKCPCGTELTFVKVDAHGGRIVECKKCNYDLDESLIGTVDLNYISLLMRRKVD